jgi:cytochrome c553
MTVVGGALASMAAGAQEGSADAGQAKAATCAACHGIDGNSVNPDWPVLAGQHPAYIARQLYAFKNGERTEVTMKPFADMLSDQDVLDVAAYFAAQTPMPKGADPALANLGQQIYRGGIPGRGVAACIACHGPAGDGNPLAAYPRLAGQHATYLVKALVSYQSGARTSDNDLNQMMRDQVTLLTDDEMRAVSSYIQGLN